MLTTRLGSYDLHHGTFYWVVLRDPYLGLNKISTVRAANPFQAALWASHFDCPIYDHSTNYRLYEVAPKSADAHVWKAPLSEITGAAQQPTWDAIRMLQESGTCATCVSIQEHED